MRSGTSGWASCLWRRGDFARPSITWIVRWLTDPRYSAALLALGKAYEGAGDPAAAAETYRRGVVIAAEKGDLSTANKMQERLALLKMN